MIVEGFIKTKQLPPAPPEVEAAVARAKELKKAQAEEAITCVETYLNAGLSTRAYLIGDKPVLVLNTKAGTVH